jgi:hypothetical protein
MFEGLERKTRVQMQKSKSRIEVDSTVMGGLQVWMSILKVKMRMNRVEEVVVLR